MVIDKRSVHRAAVVLLLVCVAAARAVSAVGDGESPSTEAALLLVPRCMTDQHVNVAALYCCCSCRWQLPSSGSCASTRPSLVAISSS